MKKACVALLLSACTASQPSLQPVTGEVATVFLHGYQGAFLDTPEGERAYLMPLATMGKGDKSLSLPWPGGPPPDFPQLRATGLLTHFTVIPFLFSREVYLDLMKYGERNWPGFVPFAYDWRQSVITSGSELCAFVEKLPQQRVNLVGHSMGGLVIYSCLSENPGVLARVEKVVSGGSPFKGGPGKWDDFFLGTPVGSNRALLSPEALFSTPSAWQLLAREPDFFEGAQVEAFSVDAWEKKGWGVFKDGTSPEKRAQLQKMLQAHHDLHARLAKPLEPAPKWLAIAGTGREAIKGWKVQPDGGFDFERPLKADGDGTVLRSSAEPATPHEVLSTGAEHGALFDDEEVRAGVTKFLRQ